MKHEINHFRLICFGRVDADKDNKCPRSKSEKNLALYKKYSLILFYLSVFGNVGKRAK